MWLWTNKQLVDVETAFTLKSTFELRLVYHRLEDRIRAHVLLCYLAMLLVRVTEHETGETWLRIRQELEKMHLGYFEHKKGFVCQRKELTNRQISYFKMLKKKESPRFLEIKV
jgi:transposase